MMDTGNTTQNLWHAVHEKVTIYAVKNWDTRASGQGIRGLSLGRFLLSGRVEHKSG